MYFRDIHGQTYNFLHKPTFIPRIRQGKVNHTLLLALCGLTARYSRHPSIYCSIPHQAGDHFIAEARKALSDEFDEPTIETIQAVIFIVQNDFFRSKSKKAMIYVSLAIRMATTLELHNEPRDPNMSFLEREARRRTYWSLIILDRLAHSGPHWQVHLRTDTLQIQLPCKDYNFEHNIPVITETLHGTTPPLIRTVESSSSHTPKGENGMFAYAVIVTILWCDINKYVMEGYKSETIPPWREGSTYHALETRLQNLFASIPKEYQYTRDNLQALDSISQGTALVHLHNGLLVSLCFLSRSMYPFNYKQMKFDEPPPKAFLERSATNIMACAKAQSSMVEDVLALEDFAIAPFVAFGVFAVSSVHIANSFSSDPIVALTAKNSLAVNLKLLVIMREYYYSIGVWCILLKDRYFQKAKRHKLKQGSIKFNGSITASIRSSEGSEKKLVGDSGVMDGFSRPGTPPVVYAPEELMSVAANKQNEPGRPSSPEEITQQTELESPMPAYDGESWQVKESTDNFKHLQQQAFARTWKRAVPQAYEHSKHSEQKDSDASPNKRAKIDKPPTQILNSGISEPTSPSQFAEIFTMPTHSGKLNVVNTPIPRHVAASASAAEPLTATAPEEPMRNIISMTNVPVFPDSSGEWLNSLELSEFTQFANDDRADFDDRNNPVHWFDGKIQQDEEVPELYETVTKEANESNVEDDDEEDEERAKSGNISNTQTKWLDLPTDYSMMSNLESTQSQRDLESTLASSRADTLGHNLPPTPQTQSLLDEIFQQVAHENFTLHEATSDSPESLSPS